MLPFWFLALGLVLLLLGGALLVRGATGVAKGCNVAPMVIGLTVVAFGTSTPELVINVTGALRGETDLAFGNAVGSNLANFGLVLGIAALLSPIYLQGQVVRREVPFLLLITAVLMVMAWDGPLLSGTAPVLHRGDAIILFLLFTIFVYFTVRDVIKEKGDPILAEAAVFSTKVSREGMATNVVFLIIGFALLTYGGQLTIDNGSTIAKLLEIPEVVIGIFVVAVGTSLPELMTSAIAAYKNETDLALGNIVGSNIFNSLVVLPAAGIITPLPIPAGGRLDLAIGFAFVLVIIPLFFVTNARLGRVAGAALVLAYAAYCVFRFSG